LTIVTNTAVFKRFWCTAIGSWLRIINAQANVRASGLLITTPSLSHCDRYIVGYKTKERKKEK
jgi:hypothetical protein